jgi:hypothetical protein
MADPPEDEDEPQGEEVPTDEDGNPIPVAGGEEGGGKEGGEKEGEAPAAEEGAEVGEGEEEEEDDKKPKGRNEPSSLYANPIAMYSRSQFFFF